MYEKNECINIFVKMENRLTALYDKRDTSEMQRQVVETEIKRVNIEQKRILALQPVEKWFTEMMDTHNIKEIL